MYKTIPEAVETAAVLADLCKNVSGTEIMVAPNFTALYPVADKLEGSKIKTGAQNLYFETQGAFTGETSPDMIRSAGAEYVIIGHSERRQLFHETDTSVNRKIKAALKAGLKPVLCIGETEAEREEEKTFPVLDKQVSDGLKGLGSDELEDLVLAYEPVWAIGTGKTAGPEQVDEVHHHLRKLLETLFSADFSQGKRILYGGSVKPENVSVLMDIKDVDGALVGGASLDAETFNKIINF